MSWKLINVLTMLVAVITFGMTPCNGEDTAKPKLSATPQQGSIYKVGLLNTPYKIKADDFIKTLRSSDGSTLKAIEINSMPEPNATLKLAGKKVVLLQVIPIEKLSELVLEPEEGSTRAIFGFSSSNGRIYSDPPADYDVTFLTADGRNVSPKSPPMPNQLILQ